AWKAADQALAEKVKDPISAAAGAYFLLKVKPDVLDKRRRWVRNLVKWFPYLADGPIVAAAMELRRNGSLKDVRKYLTLAVERGLPVFTLGLATLIETMAAVHRGQRESRHFETVYRTAQAYNQARNSKGPYLSFYGVSPIEPTVVGRMTG